MAQLYQTVLGRPISITIYTLALFLLLRLVQRSRCLAADVQLCRPCMQVLKCQEAASRDTTKLLIELQDGLQVEAVVMHYDTTGEQCSAQKLYQLCTLKCCKAPCQSLRWPLCCIGVCLLSSVARSEFNRLSSLLAPW